MPAAYAARRSGFAVCGRGLRLAGRNGGSGVGCAECPADSGSVATSSERSAITMTADIIAWCWRSPSRAPPAGKCSRCFLKRDKAGLYCGKQRFFSRRGQRRECGKRCTIRTSASSAREIKSVATKTRPRISRAFDFSRDLGRSARCLGARFFPGPVRGQQIPQIAASRPHDRHPGRYRG
jgi:hypothetical protein